LVSNEGRLSSGAAPTRALTGPLLGLSTIALRLLVELFLGLGVGLLFECLDVLLGLQIWFLRLVVRLRSEVGDAVPKRGQKALAAAGEDATSGDGTSAEQERTAR
jgi:hypothetical protein